MLKKFGIWKLHATAWLLAKTSKTPSTDVRVFVRAYLNYMSSTGRRKESTGLDERQAAKN